jgi:hypothetical protein
VTGDEKNHLRSNQKNFHIFHISDGPWKLFLISDFSCHLSPVMASQKVVTPAKAGVQEIINYFKILDSGFRRNDENEHSATFYEAITCHSSHSFLL